MNTNFTSSDMNTYDFTVIKRDGLQVRYDGKKIENAIMNAFRKQNEGSIELAQKLRKEIEEEISLDIKKTNKLTVEKIQDIVEMTLMNNHLYKSTKEYILYRSERNKLREKISNKELRKLVSENSKYFERDPIRQFVYYRTYSKWIEEKNRREVWSESVDRYMLFMKENMGTNILNSEYNEIRMTILNQEVMPSMRLLQFAGPAARRCNVCAYNCAYIVPTSLRSFVEVMYVSMRGTGCGWSVEERYVSQLPVVQKQHEPHTVKKHSVDDSAEGWCDAYLFALTTLYDGYDIDIDYSKLRPLGARLKVMGGRSSGGEVLKYLIDFVRKIILQNQGSKLSTLNVYDILCKTGEVVMAGATRRCILSNSRVLVENSGNPLGFPANEAEPGKSGYKMIKDVDVGDKVLTNNGWKPVTAKFDQGEQECLKIIHSEGELICTPNHRVAISDMTSFISWKMAGDLTLSDSLCCPQEHEQGKIVNIKILSISNSVGYHPTFDIEVQDNHCFVCEGVLVHNSAMISLSDPWDVSIRDAKSGAFWEHNNHRSMANNSAAYNKKLSMIEFMEEWLALAKSGTGERGIFNRSGLIKTLPNRRLKLLNNHVEDIGVNPCCEIFLQPQQFCNLTEVICREYDTLESLKRKIRVATILGTYQATLTKFNYLSDKWRENQDLERLLGVSLTGQWDCECVRKEETLRELKQYAVEINLEYSKRFNIAQASAVTAVKPSGCSKPETMVITSRGILGLGEIGDMQGQQWQDHDINVMANSSPQHSSKFYVNGVQKTRQILLKSNLILESTPNHQYQIFNPETLQLEWKRTDELKEGDMMPYVVGGYEKMNVTEEVPLLECKNLSPRAKPIKQPKTLNEDLAWFLGLYNGDGSNHKGGIRIASNVSERDVLEKAKKIVMEQFGIEAKIYGRKAKNNLDLYVTSISILAWLHENSLTKNYTESIIFPIQIRKSPINVIRQYIDGYWNADGNTAKDKTTRTWCTVCYTMAEQMTIILRAIGIDACIRLMPPTKTSWGKNMRYIVSERKGRSGNYQLVSNHDGFKLLDKANLKHLCPDYIVSMRDSECATFDIEVPNGNQYLANSYISHNSVSQVVNSSSGIHPRFAPYYIRRIRINTSDPLCKMMMDQGIVSHPENQQSETTCTTRVFDFPVKSPSNARCADQISAIEQLEYWKLVKHAYTEHNPSVTIYVKEKEWLEVGTWIYTNFDSIVGISFLPYSEHIYPLAPYESITKEKYEELLSKFPKIRYDKLVYYELEDATDVKKELACAGGVCEL